MPLHVVCPECRATYDLVDEQRGKKVRCKKCDHIFVAGAPSRSERADKTPEAQAVSERPARALPKKVAPAVARRPSAREEDDYDREERRRPAPRKKGSALGPILLIGGLSLLAVVVIAGGIGLIFGIRYLTKDADTVSNPRVVFGGGPVDLDERPANNAAGENKPPEKEPEEAAEATKVEDNKPVREPVVKDTPPDENGKPVQGAPGQLAPDVLRKVKRATVLIRVTMADGGQASGSGFFAFENNVLLTNAHVLGMLKAQSRPPKSIEVVLDSGDKTEQHFGAQIRGVDRDSDLAVLRTIYRPNQTSGTIPKPLEVKSGAELVETQELYVFGFPLGEALGKEITVRKSSVASLRKDNFGMLDKVQVHGGMDPGNSGGPVVDSNGDVVGVAVSGIVGTQINFAIPGQRVRSLLQGRIKEMGLGEPYYQDSKVIMPVTIHMMDPLDRVKEVALDIWTGDNNKPRPPALGEAPKELPGDSPHLQATLTYQRGTAKGDVVLPALPQGKVYYVQPLWTNSTGAKQWAGAAGKDMRPVERKPARLVLQQQKGERALTLDTEEDAKEHQLLRIKVNAQIREKTTEVNKSGATLALQFTNVHLGVSVDDRGPPEEEATRLKTLASHLSKSSSTVVQDLQGNLQQFQPDVRGIPPASQQSARNWHTQIQHALEATAVPLPNKEVNYNEKWTAMRTVVLSSSEGPEIGTIALTYTYLGTRKNATGRDEAVIGLDGTVKAVDPRVHDRVAGKAMGSAVVDLATGQIASAEANISLDATTLKVKLHRSVP